MITFHADKMHITGPGVDGGYVVKYFVGEYEKNIIADLVREIPIGEVLEVSVDIYDPDKKTNSENSDYSQETIRNKRANKNGKRKSVAKG